MSEKQSDKKKRGRPRKYTTDEQRRQARKAYNLKYKLKNIDNIRKKDAMYQQEKRKLKKN